VAVLRGKQNQQLHWNLLQLDGPAFTQKFVTVAVKGEFVELDGAYRHGRVALQARKYTIAWQEIGPKLLRCNYLQLQSFFTINSPALYGIHVAFSGKSSPRWPTGPRETLLCLVVPNHKFWLQLSFCVVCSLEPPTPHAET
jgi:hypothetical protein